MNLKQVCFTLWKSKYERKGINNDFKPLFERYIGVDSSNDYDDILSTFFDKISEFSNISLLFDSELPLGDGQIVQYFSNQLNSVDFNNLKKEDVNIFPENPTVTQMYFESLSYVLNLANQNEKFMNDSIRKNFIKKIIIWSYLYLCKTNIKLEESMNPKCIYYGEISRHEVYFLILLYRMTFDVIYINPLKEQFFDEIDKDHLSTKHISKMILPIDTFNKRARQGSTLDSVDSVTLSIEEGLNDTLYTNGVYKPWQFRKGNVTSIFFNSTIMDLETTIQEPAKVRTGFKVKDNTVSVPCFFQDIEGEYTDFNKYSDLVNKCVNGDNVLFLNDCGLSICPSELNRDNMLKLTFCVNGNGTMNIEKIKQVPFYPLNKYREEVQNLILNKINECLSDNHLYNFQFSKEERLEFVMMMMHLDKKIIRLIDGFDFPNAIPKIVIFLDNENELSQEVMTILGFVSSFGFDIVIFNPSGMFNSTSIICDSRINVIRLDKMKYDRTYQSLNIRSSQTAEKKKGFFERFFD